MNIVKKIFLGSLEVNPKEGKFWLNDINRCILRGCRIDFKSEYEKFGMIDITGSNAFMIQDSINSEEEEFTENLENVIQLLLFQVYQNNKLVVTKKEFLDLVYEMINETSKRLEN